MLLVYTVPVELYTLLQIIVCSDIILKHRRHGTSELLNQPLRTSDQKVHENMFMFLVSMQFAIYKLMHWISKIKEPRKLYYFLFFVSSFFPNSRASVNSMFTSVMSQNVIYYIHYILSIHTKKIYWVGSYCRCVSFFNFEQSNVQGVKNTNVLWSLNFFFVLVFHLCLNNTKTRLVKIF